MLRLPPLLRPRLTWEYALCSAVVAYVSYCWVFSMPLFASPLPRYTGQYPVGVVDIEAPLEKPRVVHDARFKETGEHAFKVETVLFTMYYPATKAKSSRSKHHWVPKPLSLTAEGYARLAKMDNYLTRTIFTGVFASLVGGVTVPANVDVPLATPTTTTPAGGRADPNPERRGFPVIIFSHGFATGGAFYSQFCGELASRGFVVVAIEHRDGSCPGTTISHAGVDGHPPSSKSKMYFGLSDILTKEDVSTMGFKAIQLKFRQAEIEEAVAVLKRINHGHGNSVHVQNPRGDGYGEGQDLMNWTGRLDTTHMVIAGHSFGATTALLTLDGGPTLARPFHAAVVLDPGKNSGRFDGTIRVPTLVVHSNSWTAKLSIFMGRPHFDVVRDMVRAINERGAPAWFLTARGTGHMSVTDAPILEPWLLGWTAGAGAVGVDVVDGVRQPVLVVVDFLNSVRSFSPAGAPYRGILAEEPGYPDYSPDNSKTGVGYRRFWQVHVAPKNG